MARPKRMRISRGIGCHLRGMQPMRTQPMSHICIDAAFPRSEDCVSSSKVWTRVLALSKSDREGEYPHEVHSRFPFGVPQPFGARAGDRRLRAGPTTGPGAQAYASDAA